MKHANYALAAVALGAAMISSCWHPTFNQGISASELTIRKLGEPSSYFVMSNIRDNDMDTIWFLPQASTNPTIGLLVQDIGMRLRFRSVSFNDSDHTGYANNSDEFANTLGDAYLVQAEPDGSADALIVLSNSSGKYMDMAMGTTSGVMIPATLGPFGIGVVALNLTTQATVACFVHPLPSTSQYETINWSTLSPVFSSTSVLIFTAGDQVSAPGRFLATTTYFYLSCGMADGSRAIFRWAAATANTIDSIRYPEYYGPLIGALSNGLLLAQKDNIISVLDPDCNRLFRFPSGSLRFVHERFDGAIMKCVFTRSIFARTSSHDDQGELQVEIYEIPTANLSDLAD